MRSPGTFNANQKSKEHWLDVALAYQKAKQHAKAIADFDHVIRRDPNFVDAYIGKGNALYNLDRNEEALTLFDLAIHLDPDYTDVYLYKGDAFYNLRRHQEALVSYEQAIRLNPDDAVAYSTYGDVLCELWHYEEALAAYDQSIRLEQSNAEVHNDERYALDDAIQRDPDNAYLWQSKGDTLKRLRWSEEAHEAYERARQTGHQT